MTAQEIINSLGLQEHPEGGYFKETYRSKDQIGLESLDKAYDSKRNYSTAIYFLLTSDTFSAFHKIKQDEFWHFYKGSCIKLHQISPEGAYKCVLIGADLTAGQVPQYVVPGGYWFAAEVLQKNSFALVGCTVSPGFDFADFVLPSRQEMKDLFPQHSDVFERLCR